MFRLGINYWPASSAMYWWQRFDAGEADRDFALIHDASFDSVRVFLLWEDFQPAPDKPSDIALRHLVTVADLAAHNGLSLVPTLFTGHMSGVNWIPPWALEEVEETARFRVVSGGKVVRARLKNWYSDPSVMQAQALLAREVAAALSSHPALWAYDLGNENSNCVIPPSRDAANQWLETMANAIRANDSWHPITLGLHMEDLEEDRLLGPKEAARVCDFVCMHGYPIYAAWARSKTDEMLLPFLGLVTRWLAGKDVLFEEFGAPTSSSSDGILIEEQEAGQYTSRALAALRYFGMTGAMLWCFSDYSKALWSKPPLDEASHERFFGLWSSDRSAKPAVSAIKAMAGVERLEWHDDFDWIDLTRDEFFVEPRGTLARLYERFLRNVASKSDI